eukprot:Sspe_Gene.63255::Locus_36085_Transcript_1_1_Confidence_1.000_Length_398::g.63255::m.63255
MKGPSRLEVAFPDTKPKGDTKFTPVPAQAAKLKEQVAGVLGKQPAKAIFLEYFTKFMAAKRSGDGDSSPALIEYQKSLRKRLGCNGYVVDLVHEAARHCLLTTSPQPPLP